MTEKVIAIVGMGGGVSLGTALKFGKENFIVAMIGRNGTKLRDYKDILETHGIRSEFYIGNAADEYSLKDALRRIEEELGTPDVLLYNVANVKGVNLLSETSDEVIPGMKKRGNGCILLTGGGYSLYPDPNFGSLGIGKAGIRNLSMSLAKAVEGTGIIVGTVTICGIVNASNPVHNPDNIGAKFFELYSNGKNGTEITL
jgi:NAD(P)-dependent dehydrogenase (short-subunit alcohol dehydrogenase family)